MNKSIPAQVKIEDKIQTAALMKRIQVLEDMLNRFEYSDTYSVKRCPEQQEVEDVLSQGAASQLAQVFAIASAMPGTDAWTIAVFKAEDVPLGTKVYPLKKN